MVQADADDPTPPRRSTSSWERTMEYLFLALTAVAMITFTVWVGRKISPRGDGRTTDVHTESARAHVMGQGNNTGGY